MKREQLLPLVLALHPAFLAGADEFFPGPDGWIRHWVIYGPIGTFTHSLDRPCTFVPVHDVTGEPLVAFDFIAEAWGKPGRRTERSFLPAPEEVIDTEFLTVVAGHVLRPETGPGLNPGGKLTGIPWATCHCTVSFDQVFSFQSRMRFMQGDVVELPALGGDVQNYVAYAYTYVENLTGAPLTVFLSLASDDAVQVLLGKVPSEPGGEFLESVWLHNLLRGALRCEEQDGPAPDHPSGLIRKIEEPVVLEAGLNLLLVKVLDACLGHRFRFRFREVEPPYQPVLGDRIRIHLSPDPSSPPPPLFRRMDVGGDGRADLGDAVALVFHLFGGAGPVLCPDAADADDDGSLAVNDAIFILSHLFLERSAAFWGAFPFQCCGFDPTIDGLDRCAYPEAACR